MKPLTATISFISHVLNAAERTGTRYYLDVFCDRLTKSVSEPTLARALQHAPRTETVTTNIQVTQPHDESLFKERATT